MYTQGVLTRDDTRSHNFAAAYPCGVDNGGRAAVRCTSGSVDRSTPVTATHATIHLKRRGKQYGRTIAHGGKRVIQKEKNKGSSVDRPTVAHATAIQLQSDKNIHVEGKTTLQCLFAFLVCDFAWSVKTYM